MLFTVLGEKAHASLGLLYTTPFFISACTPEPRQYSQHTAGCSSGGGREGEVLSGHACSFLRLHPRGVLRAILPCLSHFPCLLPLFFPPVSILSPMQAVHVENTLKPSVKLLGSWINANMVSRCLSRGMEYKSDQLLLAPCEAPGRPHLEYGVQLWSLYYGKDIWWIGNRQGGATEKMTQHFGTGGGEREAWRDSGSAEVVWCC